LFLLFERAEQESPTMNYLDIVLCVPLIWAAYRGFTKGLIIEVASLVALGLGIYGGLHFSDYAAEQIGATDFIPEKYLPVAAFLVTFVVIVIVVFALARLLEKVVNMVAMKLVNKLAGLLFGVLKVALILSVMLVVLNAFDENNNLISKEKKQESVLYEPLSRVALVLVPALSGKDWVNQLPAPELPDEIGLPN